ncbi:MAG: SurA N-terminal domain-containing protein, partial [bacterium]
MMNYLRGRVAKAIFWVLLACFLLFIAIELGMQGKFSTGGNAVAVVNGEAISSQEFYLVYNQELEGNWKAIRSTMTDADAKALRREILDRLIGQTLAWQEARRLKYATSRSEAQMAIRGMQVFMNQQGQFDPLRYQSALGRLGMSPELFEMEQERAASAGRVEGFVREGVRVTDLELWLEYLRWHRKMRVSLVSFPLAEAKEKITVTSAEVKEYWDLRKKEFEKVERVRIRHIVVGANPQAGPQALALAKAKVEAIRDEIRKGAEFADEAKKKSDDTNTAPRGGDLGWHGHGELIPEYDSKVFLLKPGQITDVFQTKFGYHLIKCDLHQKEEKPTFDELQGKIRARIFTERARAQMAEEAIRAAWYLRRQKDLKKAAEQVGRKPADLGWVALGAGRPAGLSATSFDAIARALVPLEPGESSEVIETPDGFFIARLDEEKHARSP